MDFTKSSARFNAPSMVLSIRRCGETQPQVWPQESWRKYAVLHKAMKWFILFTPIGSKIQQSPICFFKKSKRGIQSFKRVVGESTRNAVKWSLDVWSNYTPYSARSNGIFERFSPKMTPTLRADLWVFTTVTALIRRIWRIDFQGSLTINQEVKGCY